MGKSTITDDQRKAVLAMYVQKPPPTLRAISRQCGVSAAGVYRIVLDSDVPLRERKVTNWVKRQPQTNDPMTRLAHEMELGFQRFCKKWKLDYDTFFEGEQFMRYR